MNRCLIDLLESEPRSGRLARGLPAAFETVRCEMPKGNPAVGLLREHVLTGFFLDEFGENRVKPAEKGIERGYDIELCGQHLSVKT